MAVGIKTISNDMRGTPKSPQGRQPHAHQSGKTVHDSKGTNKILELEWEALGRKLNKPMGKENSDVEKLIQQLKDKEEQLKYAESVISQLKKQVQALQHKQQPQNHGQQNRPAPGKGHQKPEQRHQNRAQRPPQRPPQRMPQEKGRK